MKTKTILKTLLYFEVFLALMFLMNVDWFKSPLLGHLFHMDREYTFTSFFSAAQLMTTAILFCICHFATVGRVSRFFGISASILTFMAMDEALMIHEQISYFLLYRDILAWFPKLGSWVVLYSAALVGFFILLLPSMVEMWKVHRRTLLSVILGGFVFLFGALVCEVIGWGIFNPVIAADTGVGTYLFLGEVAIEEFSEMFGVSIVLCAAIDFYRMGLVSLTEERQS
jgi:hypothetical protein